MSNVAQYTRVCPMSIYSRENLFFVFSFHSLSNWRIHEQYLQSTSSSSSSRIWKENTVFVQIRAIYLNSFECCSHSFNVLSILIHSLPLLSSSFRPILGVFALFAKKNACQNAIDGLMSECHAKYNLCCVSVTGKLKQNECRKSSHPHTVHPVSGRHLVYILTTPTYTTIQRHTHKTIDIIEKSDSGRRVLCWSTKTNRKCRS